MGVGRFGGGLRCSAHPEGQFDTATRRIASAVNVRWFAWMCVDPTRPANAYGYFVELKLTQKDMAKQRQDA